MHAKNFTCKSYFASIFEIGQSLESKDEFHRGELDYIN
jgi:hypothetical protein